MKFLFFFFISPILFPICKNKNIYKKVINSRKLQIKETILPSEMCEEEYTIFPHLLLGFDQYDYSNNLIQFLAYLRIIDCSEIYNISFPISIKSDGRLRNMEEEFINITCIRESNFSNDKNIFYFNCSNPYNNTPSSVKFLNYKDFFMDDIKIDSLILTSYAKFLSSNIQQQTGINSYLKSEILFFYNSTIINQIKNITIEGEYNYNESSKNAYLILNKENEKDFPCTMENIEEEHIYILICKPLISLEGNLNFAAVNLTDINKIMYLEFYENNSYVNFIIDSNKGSKLSIGVIVAIVSICIIFFCFVGIFIYFIKIKDLKPSPSKKYIDKSCSKNNFDVNGFNSSSIINKK